MAFSETGKVAAGNLTRCVLVLQLQQEGSGRGVPQAKACCQGEDPVPADFSSRPVGQGRITTVHVLVTQKERGAHSWSIQSL